MGPGIVGSALFDVSGSVPYYVPLATRANENAQVAELVDALASGASGGNPVEVQVLSWAPGSLSGPCCSDSEFGSLSTAANNVLTAI